MTFWIFWLLFSALVGSFASRTGRNAGVWFFIAFLSSPVIGGVLLTIVWLMKGNTSRTTSTTGRMFNTYAGAYQFVSDNYFLETDYVARAAADVYKNAANRNDCDKLVMKYIN